MIAGGDIVRAVPGHQKAAVAGAPSITSQVMEAMRRGALSSPHVSHRPHFGPLLREWRQRRRISQLDLALEGNISTRHLSFLETGRAQPSRDMVLHLAEHLEVPLRDRNILLTAAGFAPVFGERRLDDPALAAGAAGGGAGDPGPRALSGARGGPALEPGRGQRCDAAAADRRRCRRCCARR